MGGRIADMLRNKRFQKGIFAAEGLVRLERNPALQTCPSCFGRLFSARLLAGFAPTVDILMAVHLSGLILPGVSPAGEGRANSLF